MTAGLTAVVILHELLHLVAHPGNGRSPHSVLGVLPRSLVFYAFYGGEISRGRFLLMVTLPFVVLSLVPAVAFTLAGHAPLWLGLAAAVNALVSGGDLVVAAIVVTQLPRRSVLRHNSWDGYWRRRWQTEIRRLVGTRGGRERQAGLWGNANAVPQ